MVLAELNIRHTRRHMPTRRVAVGDAYLPTAGTANGARLLAGVVAEQLYGLDEEQQDLLPRFLADARKGLMVPRIALRYRLQTDTHGLDRSRHRLLDEHGIQVLELDMVDRAVHARCRPDGMRVRLLVDGVPGFRPFFGPFAANGLGAPGGAGTGAGFGHDEQLWRGVSAERRWAMEVLGLRPGMPL